MRYNRDSEKNPASLLRIRFKDCDPFGHLNNARYAGYFFDAREDHLRETYDFDLYKVASEQRRGWVVRQTQNAFLKPALQNEVVRIVTRLNAASESTIGVEGLMLDSAGVELKAVMQVSFAYVDLDRGRPARHSPELMDFFQTIQWIEEPAADQSFSERVAALRQQSRAGRFAPQPAAGAA